MEIINIVLIKLDWQIFHHVKKFGVFKNICMEKKKKKKKKELYILYKNNLNIKL